MKYVKPLGPLVIVVAALMLLANPASATFTSPKGAKFTGTIKATATESHLYSMGSFIVACKHSAVEGSVSSGNTVSNIGTLTFTECGNDTVAVLQKGSLAVSSVAGGGEGTISATGAEVTVQLHRSVLGFPVTTHCIYYATYSINNPVGTFTESNRSGNTTATLDINGNLWPKETDSACGDFPVVWTGTYTVTSPHHLYLD